MARNIMLAFCALAVFTYALAAAAHTTGYFPASACKTTLGPVNGQISHAFRFQHGWAVNHHNDDNRFLECPIPYQRNTNDLSDIAVRVMVNDRHGGKSIKAEVCESKSFSPSNPPNPALQLSCGTTVSSGTGFKGFTVLSPKLSISAETRWLLLIVEIPDAGTTGKSAVQGYRVCRGNC